MPSTIPDFTIEPVAPRLLAGRNPLTADDVARLRERGVTHILDLREAREWAGPGRLGREAVEAIPRAGIERLNLPIVDMTAPSAADFDRACAFLERALEEPQSVVFVHCRAGQQRTGAILAAHVARQQGRGVEAAVEFLQRGRPSINLLEGQERAVEDWLAAERPGLGPGYRERVRGCLLAGAVGDALGAWAEFQSLAQIRRRFGPQGPDKLVEEYGRRGAITDDTQMTLFTAEGLIRASVRGRSKEICDPASVVRNAYLRWLHTQRAPRERQDVDDGWLIGESRLHSLRAPGLTCLSALEEGGLAGRQILSYVGRDKSLPPQDRRFAQDDNAVREGGPKNDSKGCGGVMRVAPVGLVIGRDRREIFELGVECAAITHGHPSGYLAAGAMAVMVRELVAGHSPEEAARSAVAEILRFAQDDNSGRGGKSAPESHAETVRAIKEALELAAQGEPSAEKVESLARERPSSPGWVAEEALAVGLYCALAAPDMRSALRLAVTHSGDSDSTGSICGQLLGARDGERAIPADWLAELELRDTIEQIADDFAREMTDPPMSENGDGMPPEGWRERYPGW